MTDDKIIKALEEYSERGMTFCNVGMPEFARCILALISRQKAENESLKIELQAMRNAANGFENQSEQLKEDIKVVKIEAIREFVEKLKLNTCRTGNGHDMVDMIFINNLAREMTEEA